ncbi:uncharacterized protein LOC116601155 [Nematostella vectensis]|uniref:uncharacterized protein LOC116601155 n=1 Tax=Nematostella vectensis TaxID=45351 RepID=UPI0013905151|nr:uncharacterized protein LOC116601155 [Nematostella vectensis]
MANIPANRRLSRGRKFLYQSEVEKFLHEDPSSRKKFLSLLPIAENTKAKLCKNESLSEVLEKLEEYSSGVCRIVVATPSSKFKHVGTGIYMGEGWVLTTSHVIRNREQVENASCVFSFGGVTLMFAAQERRAVVYRMVPPGRRPDYRNRDLTLIKLGVQYTGLRKKQENTTWERDEQELLTRLKPFDFRNLVKGDDNMPRQGDLLCAIFHGKNTDSLRFQVSIGVPDTYTILNTQVLKLSGGFDAAVSGSPLIVRRDGEYSLMGILFAGAYYNAGGGLYAYTGEGLVFNADILESVTVGMKGVDKMGTIQMYSVNVPFDERAKLLTQKSVYRAAELAVNSRILIL